MFSGSFSMGHYGTCKAFIKVLLNDIVLLTDLGSPYLYSTHGGSTRVLFMPLASARAPRKLSA